MAAMQHLPPDEQINMTLDFTNENVKMSIDFGNKTPGEHCDVLHVVERWLNGDPEILVAFEKIIRGEV